MGCVVCGWHPECRHDDADSWCAQACPFPCEVSRVTRVWSLFVEGRRRGASRGADEAPAPLAQRLKLRSGSGVGSEVGRTDRTRIRADAALPVTRARDAPASCLAADRPVRQCTGVRRMRLTLALAGRARDVHDIQQRQSAAIGRLSNNLGPPAGVQATIRY
jgi:hypothetical protein